MFFLTLMVSIALIVGGFIVPPIGIIDGSVLTAVGLLLMFAVVAQIPQILDALNHGKSIRVQKGDLTFEATSEIEAHAKQDIQKKPSS